MFVDSRDNNCCVSIYETCVVFNSRAFDLVRWKDLKCDLIQKGDELHMVFSEDGKYKININGKRINNPKVMIANGLEKGKYKIKSIGDKTIIVDTSITIEKSKNTYIGRSGKKWNPNHMRQFENSHIWENPKG